MAEIIEIIIKAVDEFSTTIESAQKKFGSLSKSFAIAGGVMVGAGGLGVKALVDWAVAAGDTAQVQEGFNKIVGENAPKILNDFKVATDGVISTMGSMVSINTAVSRGIKQENIPVIAKLADQLADAGIGGKDTAATFDLLTRAMATGQTRFLKSLGIFPDLDKAQSDYALSIGKTVGELTEEEKQTINTNTMMDAYKRKMGELPDTATSLSESIAATKNKFTDLTVQLGTALIPIFTKLAEWIQKIIDWFSGLTNGQQRFIGILALVVTGVALAIGIVLLFAAAIMVLNTAMLPIYLIIIALILIIAAIILIIIYWDEIIAWFKERITIFVEGVKAVWLSLVEIWNSVWKAIANFFVGIWNGIIDGIAGGVNLIIEMINKVISAVNTVPGIHIPLIPQVDMGGFKMTPVQDFVVTKSGEVLKTSPNDYLFGTKNPEALGGGGMTIIIEGNVYGTNPDEMAKALWDRIRRKISI